VKRIAAEQALSFDPLAPNEKTIAAMRDAPAGKFPGFKNAKTCCGYGMRGMRARNAAPVRWFDGRLHLYSTRAGAHA
jgi:hypothetical protein